MEHTEDYEPGEETRRDPTRTGGREGERGSGSRDNGSCSRDISTVQPQQGAGTATAERGEGTPGEVVTDMQERRGGVRERGAAAGVRRRRKPKRKNWGGAAPRPAGQELVRHLLERRRWVERPTGTEGVTGVWYTKGTGDEELRFLLKEIIIRKGEGERVMRGLYAARAFKKGERRWNQTIHGVARRAAPFVYDSVPRYPRKGSV